MNGNMIRSLFWTVAVVLAALSMPEAAGAPVSPQPVPPGMAKYVIVLWEAGTPLPGSQEGKTMPPAAEPDVAKLGGKLLASRENQRIVVLPRGVVKQLRKDPAVAYVQRIWTGESLADWDEPEEEANAEGGLKLASHADIDLNWSRAYAYDGSGNIKEFGDDEYVYDTAGRLVQATVSGKIETYEYDEFGNLTRKAVQGGTPVAIPVNGSSNRLVGATYDVAGNLTSRDGYTAYTWDSLGRMTHFTNQYGTRRRMLYDASDERIGTIIDASLSRWTIRDFEGQVIREYKGSSFPNATEWYWEQDRVYGDRRLIAGETQQWRYNGPADPFTYGGRRHYHLDHLGSVRIVTDSAGRSLSEHDFFPFGANKTLTYQEQLNWADPHVDSMRFAGHWRDFLGWLNADNTEYLDYMHARYYDPNQGRFLSVDPGKDWDMRQPQSWNMYSYVRNNPINSTDPTGKWVGALFGGALNVSIESYKQVTSGRPVDNRRLLAALTNGAVAGGIGGLGAGSLKAALGFGTLGGVAGGGVERAINKNESVISPGAIALDAAGGAVGGAVGQRLGVAAVQASQSSGTLGTLATKAAAQRAEASAANAGLGADRETVRQANQLATGITGLFDVVGNSTGEVVKSEIVRVEQELKKERDQ